MSLSMTPQRSERPSADQMHPRVYKTMLTLVIGLVVAIWGFFLHGPGTGLLLMVASLFIAIVIALPYRLWRISRHDVDPNVSDAHAAVGPEKHERYRDWSQGECIIGETRMRGRDAAIEALLPIAAVAFGMIAFAIVVHVIASSG